MLVIVSSVSWLCLILAIKPITLKIIANHKDVVQSTLLEL
jgi:hypothetical protein